MSAVFQTVDADGTVLGSVLVDDASLEAFKTYVGTCDQDGTAAQWLNDGRVVAEAGASFGLLVYANIEPDADDLTDAREDLPTSATPDEVFEVASARARVRASEASPLDVACPACNAEKGKPCTAPTNTGRRIVAWFHHSRTDLAREAKR